MGSRFRRFLQCLKGRGDHAFHGDGIHAPEIHGALAQEAGGAGSRWRPEVRDRVDVLVRIEFRWTGGAETHPLAFRHIIQLANLWLTLFDFLPSREL